MPQTEDAAEGFPWACDPPSWGVNAFTRWGVRGTREEKEEVPRASGLPGSSRAASSLPGDR